MARNTVVRRDDLADRHFRRTARHGVGAAGVEAAASRWRQGAGYFASNGKRLILVVRVRGQSRNQQRLRIGMQGMLAELDGFRYFDELAQIHHRYPMTYVRHAGKIMSDE